MVMEVGKQAEGEGDKRRGQGYLFQRDKVKREPRVRMRCLIGHVN